MGPHRIENGRLLSRPNRILTGTLPAESGASNKSCRSLKDPKTIRKRLKDRPPRHQDTGKVRRQRALKGYCHTHQTAGSRPSAHPNQRIDGLQTIMRKAPDQKPAFTTQYQTSKVAAIMVGKCHQRA